MNIRNYKSRAAIVSLMAFCAVESASAADLPALPVKAPTLVDSPFFTVNDNRVTIAYQFNAVSPGVTDNTSKQIYAFTHFDAWKYGTNFFNVILLKSDHNDPAAPCGNFLAPMSGCAGATEIYGQVRSTLGFNQIFNTHAFTMGPLRNVSFMFGGDGETENLYLAPAKKDVVAGLEFALDLPYKGYFNISPLYYQEWGHSTFSTPGFMRPPFTGLPDGNLHYNATWAVEMNYYMDLGFLPPNLQYFAISGRAGIYGPKGNGAYGNYTLSTVNTATEIISEPIRLTLDVSKLIWGEKYSHFLETWVAYRYRQNKFGLDDSNKANLVCFTAAGVNNHTCTEKSLYTGVTMKF
ncbi:hypothetical protein [Bradyrhizobium sp. NP1]|uniref:hypothetical protein n=1 Tax=Bradyrhizobium sp. NP1 TaxID=3049772 RepID=UPI0025A5C484|nr:hypothetical protein [Bradyrhizobium sp. NP1]WJR79223.1 hypothetical protein QOU61_05350 [Bradyrhizobium sp. NP1]